MVNNLFVSSEISSQCHNFFKCYIQMIKNSFFISKFHPILSLLIQFWLHNDKVCAPRTVPWNECSVYISGDDSQCTYSSCHSNFTPKFVEKTLMVNCKTFVPVQIGFSRVSFRAPSTHMIVDHTLVQFVHPSLLFNSCVIRSVFHNSLVWKDWNESGVCKTRCYFLSGTRNGRPVQYCTWTPPNEAN